MFGIKTHGIIYLCPDSRELVDFVFSKHGQHRCCGELVNGGWAVELERVDMRIVETLERDGCKVVNVPRKD